MNTGRSIATRREALGSDPRPAPARDAREAREESSARLARATTDGDRYELLGELATGGMATVYLGRLRRPMGFSRLVAIKCMHPQYAKDPTFASMFVDEARLTARLRHPNIVPTLDIVADGGHLLLVMEYVEGESLAGLLRLVRNANDRIPPAVACAIIHDLLLGLHEAHEARDDDGQPLAIIHRDVSPQNVVIGLDGLARVLDFGVAKARSRVHHSNEGEIKGKIPYMPAEQLFGEGIDRRVDIYAAGVLLWEALTGARLFEGASEEILVRHIDENAVAAPSSRASGVSPELDAVVLKAISKNPDDRYPTALAMAEALSAIASLPPRPEISAWMRRFASARAVPTASLGTSTRLTSEAANADSIVKVLERQTIVTSPTISHLSSFTRHAPAPLPARPTSRIVVALGVVAFAFAGVLVGRAMRAETAHAAPAVHAASVTQASVTQASVTPTATPTGPATPTPTEGARGAAPSLAPAAPASPAPASAAPAKQAPARSRAHASSPAVHTTSPTSPTSPTAPAAPAGAAASPSGEHAVDGKPASCRLPYIVDAEGHRHYKVECL